MHRYNILWHCADSAVIRVIGLITQSAALHVKPTDSEGLLR